MTTSRTHLRRSATATVLTMPLIALLAMSAAADEDNPSIEEMPSLSDSEVAGHREAISIPDVEPISIPEIEHFEPQISSSGGDTIVSLDTDVLFDFGKSDLSDSAQDAVVDAIADVPDGAKVEVVGHTDSVGSDADNLKLSKQRATAVADVIEKDRKDLDLSVDGRGEKDPVEPNESGGKDNPDGREKNRRVEIRYVD